MASPSALACLSPTTISSAHATTSSASLLKSSRQEAAALSGGRPVRLHQATATSARSHFLGSTAGCHSGLLAAVELDDSLRGRVGCLPPAGNRRGAVRSMADSGSSSGSEQSWQGATNAWEQQQQQGGSQAQPSSASSWTAKDAEGNDYLYRLGKEADNLSVTVGAKAGMIDSAFVGNFLGAEADIVFKFRQKVTRSFEHIQGDYYVAPAFMDTVVTFLAKNYLASQLDIPIPLILGVWGGKGQGKTFQVELIFKALGVEPIILSAGEMESEWAGEPGALIRNRYRDAHLVIKNKGKMSCLMINDLDAGIGRFANTQTTVNNQMVVASLMNLCDNPTRVSIGQEWREHDIVNRVPIIVTGNDFSTLWAPLIRDGRMDKFYWQPTRDDIIAIVTKMYSKDGLKKDAIVELVDTFPNQSLDFYGALRARSYDEKILEWVEANGGPTKVGPLLVKPRLRGEQPHFTTPTVEPPLQTVESLKAVGWLLVEEQRRMNEMRLSDEYMKKQVGPGIGLKMN